MAWRGLRCSTVRHVSGPWVKVNLVPIAILLVYFVLPVDPSRAPIGVLLGLLIGIAALVGVAVVIFSEVRSAKSRLTGRHLVLILEIALIAFSFTYYLIATNSTEQFNGIATRLDALYFATTVVSTVGFGDISATGQLARGVVTVNMIFNLVFLGAVVSLARERISERRHAEQPKHEA